MERLLDFVGVLAHVDDGTRCHAGTQAVLVPTRRGFRELLQRGGRDVQQFRAVRERVSHVPFRLVQTRIPDVRPLCDDEDNQSFSRHVQAPLRVQRHRVGILLGGDQLF